MIVPGRSATIGTLNVFSPLIRWSFIAHSGLQNTFGIVTDEFDVHADGYINKTERGWGLFQGDGKLGHKGPANIEYAEAFGADSLVDVDVNLIKRTLSFSINGVFKGVAFDNLPDGVKIYGAM